MWQNKPKRAASQTKMWQIFESLKSNAPQGKNRWQNMANQNVPNLENSKAPVGKEQVAKYAKLTARQRLQQTVIWSLLCNASINVIVFIAVVIIITIKASSSSITECSNFGICHFLFLDFFAIVIAMKKIGKPSVKCQKLGQPAIF